MEGVEDGGLEGQRTATNGEDADGQQLLHNKHGLVQLILIIS